jgi:hypothetical protein
MTDQKTMPGSDARRHAPATLRNRDAICAVLKAQLPQTGTVLEIASGSGEHVVHFAAALPGLIWQPSDCDPQALDSIAAWSQEAGLGNVLPPLLIDVERQAWPVAQADALLCINMLHISPWSACEALFTGAAALLATSAPLILYGPFLRHDVMTAPSNLAFDQSLRERNPNWGLRQLAMVDDAAAARGFARTAQIDMPANNLTLVYRPR